MKMDSVSLDTFRHELNLTLKLFNKPPADQEIIRRWVNLLGSATVDEAVHALREYSKENEYAPKPKNIIEYVFRDRQRRGYKNEKEVYEPAPARISKAWIICMKRFYGFNLFDKAGDIEMSFDEAIEICNAEAAKYNNPEAIPDKYKLAEYW